jgi:hypothetical protein
MTSKNSLIKAPLKATAAAGVLALAVAGGYVAHADGLNAGAVNR